jgi:ATP-dependent DNA ligase
VLISQSARSQERQVGVGLTAANMAECRWLEPVLVGQFEFLEMAPDGHLRHSRYVGLREDKKPRGVTRE